MDGTSRRPRKQLTDPGRVRLAAYAVIVSDGSLLLTRIAPRSDGAGLWTLPGGGLDWGEHPDDAVVREVYEETGLTVGLLELAGVNSHVFDDTDTRSGLHAIRFIYRGVATGEPHVTEIDGSVDRVAWVPFTEIEDLTCVELVDVGRTVVGV